jgi:DNA polymerase III alpha subunit
MGGIETRRNETSEMRRRIAESPHLHVSLSRVRCPASPLVLRLGLKYVKGLSQESGNAIVRERIARPFTGIDDLRNRVPELHKMN